MSQGWRELQSFEVGEEARNPKGEGDLCGERWAPRTVKL
jgi:hypothetical protein